MHLMETRSPRRVHESQNVGGLDALWTSLGWTPQHDMKCGISRIWCGRLIQSQYQEKRIETKLINQKEKAKRTQTHFDEQNLVAIAVMSGEPETESSMNSSKEIACTSFVASYRATPLTL